MLILQNSIFINFSSSGPKKITLAEEPNVAGACHSWICFLINSKIAEIKTTGIEPLMRENIFDLKRTIELNLYTNQLNTEKGKGKQPAQPDVDYPVAVVKH